MHKPVTQNKMLRQLRNNVAVVPIHDPDKSRGGIWIPDQAKERVDQGIVKYIGKGVKDVKIGDWVLFSGYDGQLLHIEDEGELIILPEDRISSIIELDGDTVDVPGLYFRGKDGQYFMATFEQAMEIIAQSIPHVIKTRNLLDSRTKLKMKNG